MVEQISETKNQLHLSQVMMIDHSGHSFPHFVECFAPTVLTPLIWVSLALFLVVHD